VLAIVFPIAAFVAIGFEHSIANMVFLAWDLATRGGASGLLMQRPVSLVLAIGLPYAARPDRR